jgi:dephospho-CoA kinase
MIKIGLTGGIGSGKTTVSEMIKNLGIPIIDADIISREVLIKYKQINVNIRKEFGDDYFDVDGKLKRRKLGNAIFKNHDLRQKLENLIIPYIKEEMFEKIHALEASGKKYCVVDSPTLFETGFNKFMDYTVLVYVDRNTQISRTKSRDLLEENEIINRINSQVKAEDIISIVDFVISNNGTLEETEMNVKEMLNNIYNLT